MGVRAGLDRIMGTPLIGRIGWPTASLGTPPGPASSPCESVIPDDAPLIVLNRGSV